jgi:subfamily B ATP-binding cassette protein MsbA
VVPGSREAHAKQKGKTLMSAPESARRWDDLRRLLSETGRRYTWRYAAAFALLAVVSATTAATAWLMKDVINEVFIAKSQSALYFVAAAVLVIYLARGIASYGQAVILARIGNSIVADGQKRLVGKLLSEDVGTLIGRTSTEVVQKQVLAADSARQALNLLVTVIGRDFLTLVGLVIVMVVQDPLISTIVLIALPIAALMVSQLGMKVHKVAKRQILVGVSLADQLRQAVQGFRVVKAFGVEKLIENRLGATIAEQQRNADKAQGVHARTQPLVETVAGVAVALVILYGGWRVIEHNATPGQFFSFITAVLLAYDPARRLAGAQVQMAQALVGLRIFYETLDRKNAAEDGPDAEPFTYKAGDIRFEGVHFGYGDAGVLNGLDLALAPGRTTALVGSSGAGKSTIMSLILRFWRPTSGRILVDGQDAATLSGASLRASTAYVGQDAFLFDGTIRDNILIGNPEADDAAVIAAAKAAQAHDFIAELPQGYKTPVGELASRLSGGQKQRIAIARAFLADRPILLLDEPTAALDARSEEALRGTLAELAKNRTTILIAHRLASVTGADHIAVIEAGRVVEQGNHTELLALGGHYARLYRLQVRESDA